MIIRDAQYRVLIADAVGRFRTSLVEHPLKKFPFPTTVMASVKNRIANLEKEALFWRWFHFSRFLEGLSHEQIEEIALNWRFPEPLPDHCPGG